MAVPQPALVRGRHPKRRGRRAVVGENGPELVSMRGGEQVVPGFAHGGLIGKIHAGERVMRAHPALGRVYGCWTRRVVCGPRRFGGLHGDALADARERLHRAERHEIKPLHHRRTSSRSWSTRCRIRSGIAEAITEAQSRHMTRVVDRLQDKAKHYRDIEHWAHWWLNRQYWQPTHHQNVMDRRKAQTRFWPAWGLPVQSFDRGGYLMPGATLAINNLGRPLAGRQSAGPGEYGIQEQAGCRGPGARDYRDRQ